MQSEEVAHVHLSEHAVQLRWLVVQETQGSHCTTHTYTDNFITLVPVMNKRMQLQELKLH